MTICRTEHCSVLRHDIWAVVMKRLISSTVSLSVEICVICGKIRSTAPTSLTPREQAEDGQGDRQQEANAEQPVEPFSLWMSHPIGQQRRKQQSLRDGLEPADELVADRNDGVDQ